ncbi:hypothetical protein ACM66B_006751 [Microbotryomycetes sp. NB124-2]
MTDTSYFKLVNEFWEAVIDDKSDRDRFRYLTGEDGQHLSRMVKAGLTAFKREHDRNKKSGEGATEDLLRLRAMAFCGTLFAARVLAHFRYLRLYRDNNEEIHKHALEIASHNQDPHSTVPVRKFFARQLANFESVIDRETIIAKAILESYLGEPNSAHQLVTNPTAFSDVVAALGRLTIDVVMSRDQQSASPEQIKHWTMNIESLPAAQANVARDIRYSHSGTVAGNWSEHHVVGNWTSHKNASPERTCLMLLKALSQYVLPSSPASSRLTLLPKIMLGEQVRRIFVNFAGIDCAQLYPTTSRLIEKLKDELEGLSNILLLRYNNAGPGSTLHGLVEIIRLSVKREIVIVINGLTDDLVDWSDDIATRSQKAMSAAMVTQRVIMLVLDLIEQDAADAEHRGPAAGVLTIMRARRHAHPRSSSWLQNLNTNEHFGIGQLHQVLNSMNGVLHHFNPEHWPTAPEPGWQDEPSQQAGSNALAHDSYIIEMKHGGQWTRRQRNRYT